MSGMYVKYGSYAHAPGEANLLAFTVTPEYVSNRRVRRANIVRANVGGTLKKGASETDAAFQGRLQSLIDALSVEGGDFGLYNADNTPTPHYMNSNDFLNITGNQVTSMAFPQSHNGEFSTGRDFQYSVEASYVSSNSTILDYSETISHMGTTGPQISWTENQYHAPTFKVEKFKTTQTITQRGYAVTFQTWMLPPPPALGVPFYLPDKTVITRKSPTRYNRGFLEYRLDWSYTFVTPVVAPIFPTAR